MREKIRYPITVLIVLITLTTCLVIGLTKQQQQYYDTRVADMLDEVQEDFSDILERLYFSITMLEQITLNKYDSTDPAILDSLFDPIVSTFGYRNVGIAPDGIVTYVYPLKNNEAAIGDNIFKMPDRIIEAELALTTGEIILSGPYELTQGGEAFIMRKAIFKDDTFWGFIAVVIDVPVLLEQTNLEMFEAYDYKYRFSATVNGLPSKVIDQTENFNPNNAFVLTFPLANGVWELAIEPKSNMGYTLLAITLLLVGYTISLFIAYCIYHMEHRLKIVHKELFIDRLTGLHNRKLLDGLNTTFAKNSTTYTVFFIDLDKFKPINDTYGHDTGDALLIAFSRMLETLTHEEDFIIRMGGDEFIVILTNETHPDAIQSFCTALDNLQHTPLNKDNHHIHIEFTYGYAICSAHGESLTNVIRSADRKMYVAKQHHR